MKERLDNTEIIREVMKETGINQLKLSQILGYKTQSGLSGRLNSVSMSVERFVTFIEAMGYEVVVRKSNSIIYDEENSGKEWVVSPGRKKENSLK